MPSLVADLQAKGIASPPPWLPSNTAFEALTGSTAYGCAEPGSSDLDVVGFCILPKHVVFPHLAGHIPGFGPKPQGFDQYQEHHIKDADA